MSDSAPTPQRVFGTDPEQYASGRPGYPDQIFETLTARCGLAPGTPTLEVGPGAGQATAELLARGASPLTVVEPDPALAAYLRRRFGDRLEVANVRFEDFQPVAGSFRLAASATAWHWVEQETGIPTIAHALAPGGWWASWWTLHDDPDTPDALHDALEPILGSLTPLECPNSTDRPLSFALDRDARLADLAGTGAFDIPHMDVVPWTLGLDSERARALFATFSPVLALPPTEREQVLDRIADVLECRFEGRFDRTCVTILYTAQRL